MVIFNDLRISEDSEYLVVDVSIEDSDFYKDVTIESVVIDNQDTYIVNGPSENPVYKTTVIYNPELVHSQGNKFEDPVRVEDKSYCYCYDENKQNVVLTIPKSKLGGCLKNNIFFVYIITAGEVLPDTPKEFIPNSNIAIGVVYNKLLFYLKAITYLDELNKRCSIPKKLIDYILKLKALELNVTTGNYTQVAKYWNKYFKVNNNGTNNSSCSTCSCKLL